MRGRPPDPGEREAGEAGREAPYQELFDKELIEGLTGDPDHFVSRDPVLEEIRACLDDQDCRIVLLTGSAGSGKTGLMAALARQNPAWPRYFIRRAAEPDTAYQHEGGLASFLTVIGLQLRKLRPALFPVRATLEEDVELGVVEDATDLRLASIDRVLLNPFTELNMRLRARAKRISGSSLTVVRIGEIVDAAYAVPQALEPAALLGPAHELASRDPGARIVILLDGVDELRLRDTSVDVLNWLADHAGFPANIRFVVASRPDDERLRQLRQGSHRGHVREVSVDDFGQDAEGFARKIADGALVGQVLNKLGVHPAAFTAYATLRANGNFQYLALLRAMVESAADDPDADLAWLRERADRWPDGLNGLYRDYLLRTRDRVGRAAGEAQAWERVYRPVLGVLAVAGTSLTVPQIEEYGGITAVGRETCVTALDRLGQLLKVQDGRYGFRHASAADFLAGEEAGDALRADPGRWHARITHLAFERHGTDGSWGAADPYLLTFLPGHAEACGRLDDLLEDPRFLMAPGLDLGDRGILSLLGAADRARPVARLIRQVLPMLRNRDEGTLPHLHLYASQAGLSAFADRVAALITGSSWSLRYAHWQREQVRGVIGQHAGAVNAITVIRDGERRLHAFTAGDDGVFTMWNLTDGSSFSAVGTDLEDADPRRFTALAGGLDDAERPIVVTGDSNGTVRAWDLAARRALTPAMESFGNSGRATAVGTIHGWPLVLCRADERLRVWHLGDKIPLGQPIAVGQDSAFDPLSATMVETPDGQALVAVRLSHEDDPSQEHIQVWNPWSGETQGFKVRPTEGPVTAIVLAKPTTDPGYAIVIGDINGGVEAFDVDTSEQRWYHPGFNHPVTALAAGDLGGQRVIISGDEDGKFRVWDLATGGLVSGPHQVPDLDGGITAAAIVPSWDGGRLALAGKKRVPQRNPYLDQVRDLTAENPEDDPLAALRDHLTGWESTTTERRIVIIPRPGPGTSAPSPSAEQGMKPRKKKQKKPPAAVPEPQTPKPLVVIRPGDVLHPDNNITSLAVADGTDHRILVATDGYRASVWNLTTGAHEEGPYCGPAGKVDAAALVRVHGEPRAVCAIGGTLHAWDIRSGQEVPNPVFLCDDKVRGLAVTDLNGTPVAFCTTYRQGTHVVDLEAMQRTGLWRDLDYIQPVAVGELDGQPVVVRGCGGYSPPHVVVSDARTGAVRWAAPEPRMPEVESVAMARAGDRTLIIAGGLNRTLRVWDLDQGGEPQVIQVDGDLRCLAITELDGSLVALGGGRNGEVRVVDLLDPAPAAEAIPPVSALAVNGDVLVCGTEQGIRVFDLPSGAPRPVPEAPLRDVRAVAAGMLDTRPVAMALERYGRPRCHAWYLDDGSPIPSGWAPEDAEVVALALHGDQTLAIIGTFSGAKVVVGDLATGEMIREPYEFSGRVSHVGLVTVAGLPVLVVSCRGPVFARYLDDSDRERFPWWDKDVTPPIREDKALPNASNGWATAIGDLDGTPYVACGNDDGRVALYTFPRERLAGSPLTCDYNQAVLALASGRLNDRPVLASGAMNGTVRVWDLRDTRTAITITTLAEVRAIALAEPDLCVIGTTKGLMTVRLNFRDLPGQPEPVRLAR